MNSMIRKPILWVMIGFAFSWLVASCGESTVPNDNSAAEATQATGDDDTGDLPAASARAQVSAPFNVAEIIRRVHFAFQKNETGFLGGHTTYVVRVGRTGEATFTPFLPTARESGDPNETALRGAPLQLVTESIRVGANDQTTSASSIEIADDGSLLLWRGEVAEWLQNGEEGIEQGWTFERRPIGDGELEIRLRASGLPYTGQTDQGLHFADPETGLGFRYGHGLWIDSRGRETEIPARFENGRIVLTVPADAVRASAYPAELDPLVTPEFGMDNPVYLLAPNRQSAPSVAYDGSRYLVVWEDRRASSGNIYSDVYGVRVTPSGALLTPGGIVISNAANNQRAPAVAFNGADFLVTWEDNRGANYDIYAARLDNQGEVLDTAGILVGGAAGDQSNPTVSSDGSGWLVAWSDGRGANLDLYGARVSAAGAVLDDPTTGIAISTAAGDQTMAASAFDGTNYLVVWDDQRGGTYDIYGARVSTAGSVLDASGIAISTAANNQRVPAVVFGGGQYLVAWMDNRGSDFDLYAARVTTAGVVTDATGFAVYSGAGSQQSPSVGYDGSNYLVAWDDSRAGGFNIYGARVTTGAAVLDAAGIALCEAANDQYESAIAFDGTNYLVVWHDYRAGGYPDIYGTRVSPAGAVLNPSGIAISLSANNQYWSDIISDGTNFLVVWQDIRDGINHDIYGTRVSADGTILNPSGIAICTATGTQERPAVAFGANTYVAVWSDYRNGQWDVYGARINLSGTVLDASGLGISTATGAQLNPDVSYLGDYFLTIWQDNRNGDYNIYGARLNAAGTLFDPSGIAINSAVGDQINPRVLAGSAQFLAIWEDGRNASKDIYSSRVTVAGGVQSPTGLIVSTGAGDQSWPALSFNGTYWFANWQDARNGNFDIYGTRIASTGGVVDAAGIAITTATGEQSMPTATWDGNYFFVAWQDRRSGVSLDVYGNWVSDAGVVQEGNGVALFDGPIVDEGGTVVVGIGDGRSFLSYYSFDLTPTYGSIRIFGSFVTYWLTGHVCTENDECATGFCVDGYCCNSECGADDPTDCQVCSVAAGATANGACTILPGSTVCRETAGVCDIEEVCDGSSGLCPDDAFLDGDTTCRESTGDCDAAEVCPGDAVDCPEDVNEPDGTTCTDDLFCNGEDTCLAGVCDEHAGDPCSEPETCDEETDECIGDDDDNDDNDDNNDDNDDTVPDDDTSPNDGDFAVRLDGGFVSTDDDITDDDDSSPMAPEPSGIYKAASEGDDDDDDDDSCCGC